MNLAVVYSRGTAGIVAPLVTVEVHISNGMPQFNIVGLPEMAVKESKDRVRSALLNSQFEFPMRRITVNLAPADLPKEGGRFDLPIALGILAASEQLPLASLVDYEFIGELALTGELRAIQGSLPSALAARAANRKLLLPQANAKEAAFLKNIELFSAKHLLEICAHLTNKMLLQPFQPFIEELSSYTQQELNDLADVQHQYLGKRALEIAAAGGHSLIMFGPPGTGKTMLASRLPSILPPLTETEALEIATLYSISTRGFQPEHWSKRPFRAPHHSASMVALVGGGTPPRPGEISLAHHGVLFLDELPEFHRSVLESLREPLESGCITISRAMFQHEFPARFQLVAAMNPCPCGYLGDQSNRCQCSSEQIKRYQRRLSGPILDRIDLHVEMPTLPKGALAVTVAAESSHEVRKRVIAARQRQLQRASQLNSALQGKMLKQHCALNLDDQQFLENAVEQLGLSTRAYQRILKIARTIADLANSSNIEREHLTEAINYRRLDRRSRVVV